MVLFAAPTVVSTLQVYSPKLPAKEAVESMLVPVARTAPFLLQVRVCVLGLPPSAWQVSWVVSPASREGLSADTRTTGGSGGIYIIYCRLIVHDHLSPTVLTVKSNSERYVDCLKRV